MVHLNGEKQQLVTDELVEFEEQPVQNQDFKKSRGIYRTTLYLIKKLPKKHEHVTNLYCKQIMHLELIMPKNLPGLCYGDYFLWVMARQNQSQNLIRMPLCTRALCESCHKIPNT